MTTPLQLTLGDFAPAPTLPRVRLYDIVLADPPWRFASNSVDAPGRNPRRHYPCMADEHIAQMGATLPAKPDALLFMWTTAPMLARALPIVTAWGFEYVSQLVWIKDRIGTGYWARNRHEIVLIGKRGAFPCPSPAPFPDSVIIAPVREHSRKPDDLHNRIDAAWPDADRIELFARQARPGWTAWGNQTRTFQAGDA